MQPDCTCTHAATEHEQRESGIRIALGPCTVGVVDLHTDDDGKIGKTYVWCPCLVYEEDADASA